MEVAVSSSIPAWTEGCLTAPSKPTIIKRVRRLRAILALAMSAALSAPVPGLHVHPAHDSDHHHLLHAHFGVHHRGTLPASSLAEHDADAAYVHAAGVVPPPFDTSVQLIALTADSPALTDGAAVGFSWRDHPEASIHDPPLSNCGLRAPPTFLV
jgi:hypothetical protein